MVGSSVIDSLALKPHMSDSKSEHKSMGKSKMHLVCSCSMELRRSFIHSKCFATTPLKKQRRDKGLVIVNELGGHYEDTFRDVQADGWILKQYHTIPAAILGATITGAIDDSKSFSLIHPHLVPGLDGSWTNNQTSSCQILLPGTILLKKYITTLGQVGIVNTCQRWGVPQGLYEPLNQYGEKLRLRMTCFGRNWDPITGYEKQGAPQKNIPYELIHLANTSIKDAQAHLNLLPSNFELPSMSPDMCLVNFYSCSGRLGIHQDCEESDDTLRKGLPVVSFSVGNAAEFWYGHTRDENKLRRVILESGDVLIFGGKSRLIYHGVKKILTNTSPWSLLQAVQLRPGRLNVTLRQF